MNIANRFQKLFLLVLAFASIATFAPTAAAKKSYAPPEIENFSVTPEYLFPGAELDFTVEGTPRAKASVRISGINRTIPLREVAEGVYEGSYIIKRTDRVVSSSTLRATLKSRGQSSSDTIRLPWRNAVATPPVPVVPAPVVQGMPAITAFGVVPVNKIEPGADLKFTMSGTPGGTASFIIDGVSREVPMREVKSGQYEGSYTIRRMDNFPASINITGTLEANGRTVRSGLNQSLLADAKPPVIKNLSPHNGETVPAGGLTTVSATFDDTGGLGVDPKTVRISLGGRDVTQNASISPQFFSYRADLPPGQYPVEVTARDLAGNAVRQSWRFTVGSPAAAANSLPLQIISHANNAEISGGAEIRGRTAPDASVQVQVQGVASLAGLFGITQPILNQTVRADGNGNFNFSFQPQISVPGTRYEITLRASKGDLNKDMKLVLFQKK